MWSQQKYLRFLLTVRFFESSWVAAHATLPEEKRAWKLMNEICTSFEQTQQYLIKLVMFSKKILQLKNDYLSIDFIKFCWRFHVGLYKCKIKLILWKIFRSSLQRWWWYGWDKRLEFCFFLFTFGHALVFWLVCLWIIVQLWLHSHQLWWHSITHVNWRKTLSVSKWNCSSLSLQVQHYLHWDFAIIWELIFN